MILCFDWILISVLFRHILISISSIIICSAILWDLTRRMSSFLIHWLSKISVRSWDSILTPIIIRIPIIRHIVMRLDFNRTAIWRIISMAQSLSIIKVRSYSWILMRTTSENVIIIVLIIQFFVDMWICITFFIGILVDFNTILISARFFFVDAYWRTTTQMSIIWVLMSYIISNYFIFNFIRIRTDSLCTIS